MKKYRIIAYLILMMFIAVEPFISYRIGLLNGFDRSIPAGQAGGWISYLIWMAIVLYMMCITSWYHFRFDDTKSQEKEEKRINETAIWIISMIIGAVIVIVGSRIPLFLTK